MRSGVQGLDGFEFVVVKIQNCQIRAGGQICYLCDALKIKWTVFSSYFERDYVTGFIYNLCRKILNTAHTAPVVTRLVLTVEVGEPLEPGAMLLPRVPDECLADPLQHLLPVQDHDDQGPCHSELCSVSCVRPV